jgi:eukaryotic-like serine/threonine-protein kinase
MAARDPQSPDDESVAESAMARAAALDDYFGGFVPSTTIDSWSIAERDTADGDAPDDAGLLDTILLLRQAAAADGVILTALPIPAPARIGRYAILRLAGTGGFATVWEGFDTLLRRPVAVKVRRSEFLLSESVRRRFVREAELAARLTHPHIVTTYEVGHDEGREFIAAEFCSSGSLAGWLERTAGPLQPRIAARVVRAIAGAVACAHASGVIHRDIKPANILLVPAPAGSDAVIPATVNGSRETSGLTVKLCDFGLGMVREGFDEDDALSRLTRSGTNLGTPAWMAPEQIDRGFGPVGPATDIHALGLLLDRMLTGRSLRGGSEAEAYRQVLLDEPISADRVVRGVPRDLAAIALKCLAKRPSDRYFSAAALVDDLDCWLDGRPTVARPVSPATRVFRWVCRRPLLAALASAAVVASLVAVWAGVERVRETRRVASHASDLARRQAVVELQRGFEALRSGNVASALEQMSKARSLDTSLADSLAGRWLVRRTHGEKEILLAPSATVANGGHPCDLHSISLAPDGRSAAVAAADGRIHLLQGLDGTPSVTSVVAHDEVNEVCWSPDGAIIASAGQDGVVRWWRLTPEGLVAAGEARPGGGPLYGASFSPDGKSLAVGGEDRTVRLLRLAEPTRIIDLFTFERSPVRDADVESIRFVDDDSLVVACGERVVLLDAGSGRLIREFDSPGDGIGPTSFFGVAVSPDRKRILVCGSNTTAHLWEVATGRLPFALPPHPHWLHGVAFSPDGSRIATACRDGGVRLHDATTGVLLSRFFGHVGRVWSVVFEPSGTLLTAGADGTVRRWDPARSAEEGVFRDVALPALGIGKLTAGLPLPDGEQDPALATDHRQLWHIETRAGVAKPLLPVEITEPYSHALDLERGRLAVSRWTEQPITVYSNVASDRVSKIEVELPPGASPADAHVAWAPTGELVIHTRDRQLFWCPAGLGPPRRLGTTAGAVDAMAVAPAGAARVALAGVETVIQALPTAPGYESPVWAPIVLRMSGDTTKIAWSPDGSHVACTMRSGGVHIFDGTTGAPRGTLTPHAYPIEAIAYANDGRTLVAVDRDCIRFYDVPTLVTLDEFRPGLHMSSALLSTAGDRIVIAGNEPNTSKGRVAIAELPRQ